MSDALPACPECHEAFTYEQGALLVCPMCGHEWSKVSAETTPETTPEDASIKDAVGNVLADGDTVTIVKDLKVKGAGGGVVKVGTKVRGIRLIEDGVGDHDIDATVPGFGRMQLKSSVVKKVL
ncbi:zinc ribbon domain-containing protein YjdM [Arthrobacter sp. NPDC055138]